MTKEEFIKRCYAIKRSHLDRRFEQYIKCIIDEKIVDIENLDPNYRDIYPVIASICDKVSMECVSGRIPLVRKKNKIRNRLSIWMLN